MPVALPISAHKRRITQGECMTSTRMTRTYEGRVPAKPLIENGVLWIPVQHHIEGVFENRAGVTTVTFAQATGTLADDTLALANEFRSLREQIDTPPHPGDYFAMKPISALPSTLNEPVERAGWQFYTANDEKVFYASQPPSQDNPQIAYYCLSSPSEDTPLPVAMDAFERAIVEQGHSRIKLKQLDARMRENTMTLRLQMENT
jgi:hypothetical protein